MHFKIIHCLKIDAQKWNLCVEKYQMDIYNEYHFLNAVCLDNWYGFVWGDYGKILPFYRKKKWGVIPYVCMPPFCQKFDNSPLTKVEWSQAIQYLKGKNVKLDYAFSDNKGNEGYTARFNFILNKNQDKLEKLKDSYSGLLKKNIEKAKARLNIKLDISEKEHQVFIDNLPMFKDLVLRKYAKNYENLRQAILSSVYAIDNQTNIPMAMLEVAHFKGRAYCLFPYSTDEGKKSQAMSLLIDHLITLEDVNIVDFEGSSMESIAHFYSQFGAEKQSYWALHWKNHFFPF